VRGAAAERASEFEIVRAAITAIRQVRADYNIPPGKLLDVVIIGQNSLANDVMIEESALIGRLARATITTQKAPEMPGRGGDNWAPSLLARVRVPEGSADMLLSDGSHVIVQLAGTIDVAKECAKASDELTQLEKQLLSLEQRLGNESFTARAKPEVVESERRKLGEWRTRREQLAAKKKALCGD
jgi:valyl-tRNA synthetase